MTLKMLAVDTATENCSVALCIGDQMMVRSDIAPREHTNKILPMVDEVLAEAGVSLTQLDALAFGRGPGSFTGVRIGIGIAQGLAFGADLPVLGVSTLAAMAEQAHRTHGATQVLTAIDARMGELYFAQYQRQENGDWHALADEAVVAPDALCLESTDGTWALAGTGWPAYPELATGLDLTTTESGVLYPQAQDMLVIAKYAYQRGEAVAAELATPTYLRDKVTWKKLPGRE
ncbi:tRNA (adenosine(37)-N6)-threonylcarbamoyltransferase complex dimerization subunit type 1 TsaB [Salinivibrio sp. YCSC6]|uniref:tRNA (adenosine(37)-N6)-threonylcarbamoyltransferase complex dimerization subunit type 1 TsaB n=1 Tax=Salinivibrio sp. YCSC6 TaxID=2003370 RepID=UPI000BBC91E8|nr:tRNA (adenosine(37)-N6)-threonylcarbamoyltransferase complex dimerization subunit type 1 TsaB [Salinivibrio sp. YCSC6]PCE66871.1 tRNA (adenosine(37)-N6)-threonylcarbamoyltransferase complex dimerization subunit type 1 TsaB [Salinivibrio sp. YCSC6]QCF36231.1 tRNA (adenosine(37)-N6)-threonylcarbamoyltransferase complex dimerization subunit type 1 TsaB [Salinivibrio sp. YCSC6]